MLELEHLNMLLDSISMLQRRAVTKYPKENSTIIRVQKESFASCWVSIMLLSKWPIGARDKSVQARDSKCWDCDYDVRDISRYLLCGAVSARYQHTALHLASFSPCRDSNLRVYLKMKSPHSSCCCLISSDLSRSSPMLSLSSPNTSTSPLITSLHPALSISASRLNLCFENRKSVLFLFVVVLHTGMIWWSGGSKWMMVESQWWSICWEQAITSPRTVMLCCDSLLSPSGRGMQL